jgi:Aldose 1-epimerase
LFGERIAEGGGVRAASQSLTVRVPLAIPRRGGRKIVVTPDGEAVRAISAAPSAHRLYTGQGTLETQHFPDSPNHPNFPTTELKPGQNFDSTTVFRFGVRSRLALARRGELRGEAGRKAGCRKSARPVEGRPAEVRRGSCGSLNDVVMLVAVRLQA